MDCEVTLSHDQLLTMVQDVVFCTLYAVSNAAKPHKESFHVMSEQFGQVTFTVLPQTTGSIAMPRRTGPITSFGDFPILQNIHEALNTYQPNLDSDSAVQQLMTMIGGESAVPFASSPMRRPATPSFEPPSRRAPRMPYEATSPVQQQPRNPFMPQSPYQDYSDMPPPPPPPPASEQEEVIPPHIKRLIARQQQQQQQNAAGSPVQQRPPSVRSPPPQSPPRASQEEIVMEEQGDGGAFMARDAGQAAKYEAACRLSQRVFELCAVTVPSNQKDAISLRAAAVLRHQLDSGTLPKELKLTPPQKNQYWTAHKVGTILKHFRLLDQHNFDAIINIAQFNTQISALRDEGVDIQALFADIPEGDYYWGKEKGRSPIQEEAPGDFGQPAPLSARPSTAPPSAVPRRGMAAPPPPPQDGLTDELREKIEDKYTRLSEMKKEKKITQRLFSRAIAFKSLYGKGSGDTPQSILTRGESFFQTPDDQLDPITELTYKQMALIIRRTKNVFVMDAPIDAMLLSEALKQLSEADLPPGEPLPTPRATTAATAPSSGEGNLSHRPSTAPARGGFGAPPPPPADDGLTDKMRQEIEDRYTAINELKKEKKITLRIHSRCMSLKHLYGKGFGESVRDISAKGEELQGTPDSELDEMSLMYKQMASIIRRIGPVFVWDVPIDTLGLYEEMKKINPLDLPDQPLRDLS